MPTVAIKSKPMITSKTFWVNSLFLIVSVVAILNEIAVATSDIIYIPSEATRWLLFINTVANIILRRVTEIPARFAHGGEMVVVDDGYQPTNRW